MEYWNRWSRIYRYSKVMLPFNSYICVTKFFNTQILIASIRIFLHWSGENISGYLICSDPLYFRSPRQIYEFPAHLRSNLWWLWIAKKSNTTVNHGRTRRQIFLNTLQVVPEMTKFEQSETRHCNPLEAVPVLTESLTLVLGVVFLCGRPGSTIINWF